MKLKNDEKPKRHEEEFESLWTVEIGEDGEALEDLPVEVVQPAIDLTPVVDETEKQVGEINLTIIPVAIVLVIALIMAFLFGGQPEPASATDMIGEFHHWLQTIAGSFGLVQMFCGVTVAVAILSLFAKYLK